MDVKIMDLEEAEKTLKDLNDGAKEIGGKSVVVGTWLNYAWGIEFGRHRSGKLARRAGGSFALTGALRQVKPRILPTVREALPKGRTATLSALKRLGLDVLGRTLDILTATVYATPIPTFGYRLTKKRRRSKQAARTKWKRTGTLRRSYHMQVGGQATGLRNALLRSRYGGG